MAEKIHSISAGSTRLYEVVESEDGLLVTIREAEDHSHKIELIGSVLPTLIEVLQEIPKKTAR